MASRVKAGRNDSCPCGSGKKFKRCCGAGKERRNPLSTAAAVMVGAIIVAAVAYGFSAYGREGSTIPAPGRTWSPEHGHYH